MESTIIADFDTRREAELDVEHVVQECDVERSDVFVQPAGADAKDAPEPDGQQKLQGAIEVSVDFHGVDRQKIAVALKSAGAKSVCAKWSAFLVSSIQ